MQYDLRLGEVIPDYILDAIRDPYVIKRAWNANFERVALSAMFNRNPPHTTFLDPRNWYCTMVEAQANGLPGALGRCAAFLNLEVQKMTEGKALIKLFSTPQQITKKNPTANFVDPNDEIDKWNVYKEYNRLDVETEFAIECWLAEHGSHEVVGYAGGQLWREYWLDQRINDMGIPVNIEALQLAEFLDGTRRDELEVILRECGIDKPNSPASIIKYLQSHGLPDLNAFNKDTRRDIMEHIDEVGDERLRYVVSKAVEIKSLASQKPMAMLNYAKDSGAMRGTLAFLGATRTGRWSGRGPQVQNLKRNDNDTLEQLELMQTNAWEFYSKNASGNIRDTIGAMSRFFIQAPAGKKFVVVDFSAIEARVLAWLAGEQWVLDVFIDDRDIYIETAGRMFSSPFKGTPPRDNSAAEHDRYSAEVDAWGLRSRGKVAVLALGYQGGANALEQMDYGKEIPAEEYDGLKVQYREQNPNIVRFWKEIDRVTVAAVQMVHATDVPVHYKIGGLNGRPEIWVSCVRNGANNSARMDIILPSGRRLVYQDVKTTQNSWGAPAIVFLETGGGTGGQQGISYNDTYGGKLTENITQAVARDLLAHTLLEAYNIGYTALFSVHDEGVWIADESEAANAYTQIQQIMATPPEWAQGLPLDSDGFVGKYYKK